jgi:hypothetical protein
LTTSWQAAAPTTTRPTATARAAAETTSRLACCLQQRAGVLQLHSVAQLVPCKSRPAAFSTCKQARVCSAGHRAPYRHQGQLRIV